MTPRRHRPRGTTDPVLFGGVGRYAALAALVAAEVDTPGLVSIDGSLLSVSWRLSHWASPTLLLASPGSRPTTRLALSAGGIAAGRQARVAKADLGTVEASRSIRESRRATVAGTWPQTRVSPLSRVAAPAAAVIALGGGASLLAGSPVAAAQRAGTASAPTSNWPRTKRRWAARRSTSPSGRAITPCRMQAGSEALTDNAGFKWFVNTDITFSTSSSASGAMSEGKYTHTVPASTLNGGTTASTLNDAYDGYNALFVSVNGTFCTELSQGCTSYNKNGPATLSCNNREVNTPVQVIDGLNVSRRIYVPTDDHFAAHTERVHQPGVHADRGHHELEQQPGLRHEHEDHGHLCGWHDRGRRGLVGHDLPELHGNHHERPATRPRAGERRRTGPGDECHLHQRQRPSDLGLHLHGRPRPNGDHRQLRGGRQLHCRLTGGLPRLAALPATTLECMSATDQAELANFKLPTPPTPPIVPSKGYWLTDSIGGVYSYGVPHLGSLPGLGITPAAPVVGIASTPDHGGYWLAGTDGGVYAFGDARYYGSMGGRPLNKPIVRIVATPTGKGYWLVASDGGVFAFGDAQFHGSEGGTALHAPIVGMAATQDGGGYWLVGADGGVFALGDAPFSGRRRGRP